MDHPHLDFPASETLAIAAPLPAIPQRNADPFVILGCVCEAYAVSVKQLLGTERHKATAEAKTVCYWLLRTRTKLSFPEIGRVLDKDHTTVLAGVKRCVARRAADHSFVTFTDELAVAVEARLKGGAAA